MHLGDDDKSQHAEVMNIYNQVQTQLGPFLQAIISLNTPQQKPDYGKLKEYLNNALETIPPTASTLASGMKSWLGF